ncbi:MAG: XRE family transcriptional regulator [Defluviitaleaceae bacterium]|nr:XRE family transcriptional regulator [Defluviitaleaceae bacterium]
MEKLAELLNVNVANFTVDESGSLEHVMQMFFWLDEILPGTFNPVQLERNKKDGKPDKEGNAVTHNDSDVFPAAAPMAIWLNNPTLNQFVREWMHRKQELRAGEITREEYFEWKLNWPRTCDDCGRIEPSHQWRVK